MRASTSAVASCLFSVLTCNATALPDCKNSSKSITVDDAPDFVRPYVLPRYRGRATYLTPTQIIRYSVTTNSSGGAFSLVQHSGSVTGWTPARPHTHRDTHEHFYCAKGRCEFWGQKNATGASQEARVGTIGDYANLPPDSIHTFQLVDPDTQMTHIFHPAGFEHLFDVFSLGEFDSPVGAPYLPSPLDPQPFQPLTPEGAAQFATLDLFAADEKTFVPRRDLINGTATDLKDPLPWHNGENKLPEDPTEPYFVAKDYGPKYLNTDVGYKVIQPLVTPTQAPNDDFTMGTIIMSPKLANETVSNAELPHHFALQMDEGQLVLAVEGYEPAYLLQGDVAFIPQGTKFEYHATVPYTKFLYLNGGSQGLDHELLRNSTPWGWPSYPVHAGYKP